MKKVFLISLFVIFGLVQMSAQMAVTDPGQMAINQAGWASSLEKAASQIEILTKNKEILTESINLYAKVSGFLKTSQLLFNVIDRQVKRRNYPERLCQCKNVYEIYRQSERNIGGKSRNFLSGPIYSYTIRQNDGRGKITNAVGVK